MLLVGVSRNCGVRNVEGKMRNGMCGATVIGRDVTSRDRTPCVDSVEVKSILSTRKIPIVQSLYGRLKCGY